MRLYHHPLSTCSRRVRMTARHLGMPLELVQVDLTRGEQHAPAFLALNPNHRVPVLEHAGFVLWESYAIMQYLAELTPGQTLYPVDPQARADVNRWLFWCGQSFMPGVSLLNWENAIKALVGLGPADPAQVQRGEQLLGEAAQVLDQHLAHRDWLCGSAPTLADIAIAAPLVDQARARMPLAAYAPLQRWLQRVQALPSWDEPAA